MCFKDKSVGRNKSALGNVHVQGKERGRRASRREIKERRWGVGGGASEGLDHRTGGMVTRTKRDL